ncbi:MAG: ribosome-associated translation inhibitor RaiA [Bacteroidales bacterium]|nr:ribosome-associated translation inhibitor RaiA [Bacteroidales bacterium]
MKVKISSLHFKAGQEIENYVTEKIKKLSSYYEKILESEVILKESKSGDQQDKIIEIKLLVPGNDLFVKKQCKTFQEATDLAVDALKKQLERHKERKK